MILATDSYFSAIVAVEAALLYLALITVADEKRRVFHRRLYATARGFLCTTLGLSKLATIDPDACTNGPGWKILPFCFSIVVMLLGLVYLFNGHVFLAVNALATTAVYSAVTYYAPDRRYVLMFARAASAYQLLVMWVMPNYLEDPRAVFRGILGRAMGAVVFFDAMDESSFHMLAMTLMIAQRLGWNAPMCFLPLKICVYFLFPIQLIGIREWICSQRLFIERPAEANRRFFLAVMVPMMTILFSFVGGAESEANHLTFLRVIGGFHLLLFGLCLILGEEIDQVFGAERSVQSLEENLSDAVAMMNDMDDERASEEDDLGVMDIFFIVTSFTAVILNTVWLFLAMIALLLVGKVRKILPWRRVVLFAHSLMLVFALEGGGQGNNNNKLDARRLTAIVILTTLRVILSFETKRSFSQIQRDSAFFAAVTAFAVTDNSRVALMAFLLVGSIAVSLVVVISREHSARTLKRENDSSAFLSHALKQKFSAVGGVAEHLLENRSKMLAPKDEEGDRPDARAVFEALLLGLLLECRKGEHSCHALNVIRNIKQRTYRGQTSVRNLRETILFWAEMGTLALAGDVDPVFAEGCANAEVEMDWDLFQVFLCRWAKHARSLRVECVYSDKDDDAEMRLHLTGHQSALKQGTAEGLACVLLAKELKGWFLPSSNGPPAGKETFAMRCKAMNLNSSHEVFSTSLSTTLSRAQEMRRSTSLGMTDVPPIPREQRSSSAPTPSTSPRASSSSSSSLLMVNRNNSRLGGLGGVPAFPRELRRF